MNTKCLGLARHSECHLEDSVITTSSQSLIPDGKGRCNDKCHWTSLHFLNFAGVFFLLLTSGDAEKKSSTTAEASLVTTTRWECNNSDRKNRTTRYIHDAA